jgi:transcriptional regulator with XRE-family HTH domain
VTSFDLPGVLRRIRRMADLSQRELAERCSVSQSTVARAESARQDLTVRVLEVAARLAGLRLALLDDDGREVTGMAEDTVRDMGGRRFPAHLDTRYSDEHWWHGPHRYSRDQPWYTFDRDRRMRDLYRGRDGVPTDHQLPQPGDSPRERAEERLSSARRARAEERQRRFLAGEFGHVGEGFVCTCPGECDELDDRSGRPVHAAGCPCNCDLA